MSQARGNFRKIPGEIKFIANNKAFVPERQKYVEEILEQEASRTSFLADCRNLQLPEPILPEFEVWNVWANYLLPVLALRYDGNPLIRVIKPAMNRKASIRS